MPKLYNHQKAIIADDPKKCGLFLGTGSGKSRIGLFLAEGKTFVVCPKTQREDANWERELSKIKKELAGTQEELRLTSLRVISKEEFRAIADTLEPCDTLIFDEGHTILGMTPNLRTRKRVTVPKASQLYEAAEAYIDRCKPKRLYIVTATITKSPMTVLAAGRLLGKFPKDIAFFYQFRHQFYTKLPMPGREVWAPKYTKEAKDNLAGLVKGLGYLGRLEDFFDVPEQTFRTMHIELNEKQKRRIKDMALLFPDPIVRLGKRLSIENGILNGNEFAEDETFENGKLDQILDYAIEFPKMIVFSRYLLQIEALKKALEKAGKKVFVMTGDTKERGALIASVIASDDYVFLVSAQISSGWEVPNCHVMIFASRTYSFVDLDQSYGRIHRAHNLKKNLYITLVAKGGVDEALDKTLAQKKDFNERVYLGV